MSCWGPPRATPELIAGIGISSGASAFIDWAYYAYWIGGALVVLGVAAAWLPFTRQYAMAAIGAGLSLGLTGHFMEYFDKLWYVWLTAGVILIYIKYRNRAVKLWKKFLDKRNGTNRIPPP